jgi:uncharacterized protein YdhG (YjbR/CyaY superfamily)
VSPFFEYLSNLAEPERAQLAHVCEVVQRVLPDVEEGQSYGIPAFKYRGSPLLGLLATKKHLSLFPFGKAAVDHVRGELTGFSLSSGTIRFTPERPVPDLVLEKLIRFKQREIDAK